MSKRPTMNDIAQRAGVSQATVSLVLANVTSARVSDETRARVRAVALDMGYVRRGGLVPSAEVKVIGLIIDEVVTTPFAAPFLEGARLEAAESGALVSLVCTGADPATEAAAVAMLRALGCIGILYTRLMTRIVRPPAALAGLPTVLLNCHAPGGQHPSVVPADVAGAEAAVTELVAAGHRRIAHLQGETWAEATRDRTLGYRRALAAAGLPFDAALVAGPTWTAVTGRQRTLQLIDLPDPPTAFFCYNDRVALGCYEALDSRGLRVPQDISVVGFDNDEIAATLQPPLTTMVLPHEEMARRAVRDLLAQGTAPQPARVKIGCELIRRGSVAPPHRI